MTGVGLKSAVNKARCSFFLFLLLYDVVKGKLGLFFYTIQKDLIEVGLVKDAPKAFK